MRPILLLLCYCSSSSAFSSSLSISAAISFQRSHHYAISESSDGDQQRGMEEAFASLEALSPSDWNDDEKLNSNGKDDELADLKFSPTDDTGASTYGKATREEVEHYLEMTTELDGTAAQNMEQDGEEEEGDIFFDSDLDVEDVESSDVDEDLPWESINPILRLRGQVATGYGRGGKQLGVPTANLPSSLFQSALEDVNTGVYFGWAVIEEKEKQGRIGPIKAVVNVGYSPTFEGKENKEKIVEAHLITKSSPKAAIVIAASISESILDQDEESDIIDEIEEDFYGETMRLQLIGFLRPEQKFESFPDLIAQIHRDIGTADIAMNAMPFIFSKEDSFIQDGAEWVGSNGGDDIASWEFETW